MSKEPRKLPTNLSEAEGWLIAAQARVDKGCPECGGVKNCKGEQGAITAKTLRVLYNAGYWVRSLIEADEYEDIMVKAANWKD